MASLLNNASLLLNPAGSIISYQEDKIYSVLPSNGAGDFTFTGGDGGTRVNQQGYIEQTPFNLFQYSNAFNTSPWAMAVTGGQTGKDGAANAWLLTKAGATTSDLYNALTVDGVQTFSIYVKKESSKGIKIYNFGTATQFVTINIETGANYQQSGAGIISYQAVAYNSNWWRVQVTMNCTNGKWYIYVTNGTNTQIQSSITIQDAQLVVGSDPKPYQPTTDRLNYPRITYQNGRGAILSEPQRTNVLTNSQNFNLTPHILQNATVTTGSGISPDGTNNANKLISSGGSSTFYRWYDNLGALGGTYVYSIFAKADSGSMQYVCIGINTNASNGNNNVVEYNIVNGTVSRNPYGVTAYVEPYKDGWYRLVYIYNLGTAGSFVHPCIAISNGTATLSAFQNLWDSTSGQYVYLWGSQYEAGSFPTSYIPTTSATVTRPNDYSANITGFQTSGVASNGAWSMILEGSETTLQSQGFQFFSSAGNYLGGHFGTTFIYMNSSNAETYPFGLTQPRFRIGMSWNGTTLNIYRNGISVLSTTNVLSAYNTFNSLRLHPAPGSAGVISKISYPKAAIYNTALSTTQLQELTTYRSGSGGNISYYGPYTVHTFTGSATFTPSFNGQVEVLIAAGGGGGGQFHGGGGGGAGGLLYASSYGVAAGSGITVTVGSGGAITGAGSNSVFGGLTTIGGGLGASEGANNGGNGGSGGGGTGFSTATNGGLGTPGQGFDGGKGGFPDTSAVYGSGGGGGGASAPGTDGKEGQNVSGSAGNGGNGLPYSINGFSTYYAGGGGGGYWGDNLTYYGVGGLGGGGNGGAGGSASTLLPTPGVNGLGGGGGGSRGDGSQARPGSTGGSGIVIVRYLT